VAASREVDALHSVSSSKRPKTAQEKALASNPTVPWSLGALVENRVGSR
jgi:hypothetical protein